MPTVEKIAEVLRRYAGRYEFLDAFADDVDELRGEGFGAVNPTPMSPTAVAFETAQGRLVMELFANQGIARFRLANDSPRGDGDQVATAAVLGGLVGAAVNSASKTKEGLLGGIIVGMLVGGMLGARQPVERVLALRFEPASGEWQVYDGPLLRWAKRTLHPVTAPLVRG